MCRPYLQREIAGATYNGELKGEGAQTLQLALLL
jgi:hypothetical protein